MKFNLRNKKFSTRLFIFLFIIIFLGVILFLGYRKNNSSNYSSENKDTLTKFKENILKRRYFSLEKRVQNFSALILNAPITSVFIKLYEFDGTSKYFFYINFKGKKYITDETKFLYSKNSVYDFPLVRINFPFLNVKDNVYPYLHPLLTIKMLYIFSKVNFNPRLSDALRDLNHQLRYKRRSWSNVEKSPHLIGLAFDISRYTGSERKIIEDLSKDLSLSFLQHGGRRNMHIHIQDDKIWTRKDIAKNVINISKNFEEEYFKNATSFNKYEAFYPSLSEKFLYPLRDSIYINTPVKNVFSYKFNSNSDNIIKIQIFNILGNITAEIYSLINKGNNEFLADLSFLASGIYKIKLYSGLTLLKEELVKIY